MDTSENDYPANVSTPGTVTLGSWNYGVIDPVGDADWFKVSLSAGQQYRFTIEAGSVNGLFDPQLAVYNSSGTLVVQATIGQGFQSKYVDLAPTTSADYFLSASGGTLVGSYKVSATGGTPVGSEHQIIGTTGNDSLTGTSGNDILDGGAGNDTTVFSSNLAKYTLTKTGSTYTVRDNSGTDGTDTLTNIESLKFTDITVNLTVQSAATTVASADLHRLEELYVAFFNRVPDADGLAYWIGQFKAGMTVNQIAESFYTAGASSQYSSLTGFSTSMSNSDFINVFYKNVLGRPEGADAGGLSYWNGKLADGSSTRSSLASDILNSAHTFKGDASYGWVADLLDNKITVANKVAVDWGLNYNADAYTHGVDIAKAVTSTSTDTALSLVGISAADMNLG